MIAPLQPSSMPGVSLREAVGAVFSPEGGLASVSGSDFVFEARTQQVQMATSTAEALENGRHLIVEAGTGVGKSLAYAVPLLPNSCLLYTSRCV